MPMPERLRNAAADALMLFVVPCFVALLPWRIGFAVLKRMARSDRLYRLSVEPAWNAAHAHDPDADEREWKYHFRLLRLVDHVDVYLTLLRGMRWRMRHVVEKGGWPAPGPCVFLTCHWGAGGWIWPRLRERGFDAHFVARRASGRALGMTRLSHRFGIFRAWALRRSGSAAPIFTGASAIEVTQALCSGRSVVAMLDLPARSEQQATTVSLLGRRAQLPIGMARIAVAAGVPITLISCGLNPNSGQRDICVETLTSGLTLEQVMQRYAAHLDMRLREIPAYWQIWREAPGLFIDTPDDQAL
ncbi:MAG: hypothetical protein JSS13_10530 [Proteobacteria bacterium]|nr:hypothetical protein [Pseudomonadota bacterium]